MQARFGSMAYPQGQGFMAAPIMNLAGQVTVPLARLIEISPSSMGSRKASRTLRLNSGSSSRNKTPLWARLASPGFSRVPPPTSDTMEALWWGVRNGRTMTGLKSSASPAERAHECIRDVSRISSSVISGKMPGRHFAHKVLPAPGEPTIRKLCAPAAATSRARFTPSMPMTFLKSGISLGEYGCLFCSLNPAAHVAAFVAPASIFSTHSLSESAHA